MAMLNNQRVMFIRSSPIFLGLNTTDPYQDNDQHERNLTVAPVKNDPYVVDTLWNAPSPSSFGRSPTDSPPKYVGSSWQLPRKWKHFRINERTGVTGVTGGSELLKSSHPFVKHLSNLAIEILLNDLAAVITCRRSFFGRFTNNHSKGARAS